jgi:predicted Zn-dependent peptidase
MKNIGKQIDHMKQELSDFGLDYSFYSEYLRVLHNITSEQLMQLAQQYLNPDDCFRVFAGSRK